ncbi:Telomere repeat-binding factor 4 [Rhynchospora pubera]|uniref:Telomere repeat-binding factor 4 n=1 Tax=Rhynchospora pubera TaxID=906938 RepID=A0AAV8F6W8_9POAL|nr:Telomere repeat-binding factor 4 [Rhynchospora pubera]
MGAPKQKWTSEEEEALKAGVNKHGAGKWRNIQKDPEFSHLLASRSNIDLKDKWRNMSVSYSGLGSREKTRTPKMKLLPSPPRPSPAAANSGPSPSPSPSNLSSISLPSSIQKSEVNDPAKKPKYNSIIMDALSSLKSTEPNGSEIGTISNFIELKHEVPENFRRLLSSKLRRLIQQNRIEKVGKAYRLKEASFGIKSPVLKQKDTTQQHRKPQNNINRHPINSLSKVQTSVEDPIEEEAKNAASRIADAEAKCFFALEAAKSAENIFKMSEEADAFLILAEEIYDRCSRGEVFTITY